MKNKISILIVEDDSFSSTFLVTMLDNSGLPVETITPAASLAEAFEALNTGHYDVILLDLNLPDSRGHDTLTRLTKQFPDKVVIVITGEFDEETGLKAISRGAQDYLLKGKYSIADLAKSIRYSIGRKEAQEAAKRSERVFKTLINNLPQRVVLKDLFSRYQFCNRNFAESLDASIADVLGKTDYDFYPEAAARHNVAVDWEVIQTSKSVEDVLRYDKNGRECITRVLATAVKNEVGTVEGVLCVYEDFTKRVQYEEEIQKANEELQKTNLQLKEMQSQLVQNEKLASIGQLAAGVAHEINNPLGFVSSNFTSLEKYLETFTSLLDAYENAAQQLLRNESQSAKDLIEQIEARREEEQLDFILNDIPGLFADSKEGIRRIIQIVKSLRDFSRIDQPEDFSEFSINQGLQATLMVAQNELKYAVTVETEYADVPDVFCNSGQLNQVFLNILVNAAQAIAEQQRRERGTISIKTYFDETYVSCDIKDDGPGIPEKYLSKIFDPFFTTKPVGQGTGLGLNLSYDIVVNKHKGKLLVDTHEGQGTTFTIRIPRNLDITTEDTRHKEVEHGIQNDLVCR
ncbi:MAG: response regulator [Phycisphaerae bacterium]|nr:response regulator [Phycisphaerae bacterium]